MTCSVAGCEKKAKAKGLCSAHYERLRISGSLRDDIPIGTANGAPMAWIKENSDYDGDACLIWPFSRGEAGYGAFGGRYAHREMCEEVNGPPPSSKHDAAHSCGNGHLGCVSPGHLTWKTRKGNCGDTIAHGRTTRGEKSATAKLSRGDVQIIRALRGERTQIEIAELFGVTQSTVSAVQLGKNWGWLNG